MTKSTHTNLRLRLRGIAAIAVVAIGAGAAVPAMAAASHSAPTKVTITPENDGFFGTVSSSRTKCESGRKVVILKQLGSTQSPGSDQRVLTTTADEPQGNAYRWDTGNSGHMKGKFYARVSRIPGCHAASSPSVKMLPNN
jgi:hypothetical protein